ncbi:Tetratricopeptide-like helical domain [Trinorchestia longiramus]|nr:Tetratricopeptide-like helical domain [Trinorchestia longiramus]
MRQQGRAGGPSRGKENFSCTTHTTAMPKMDSATFKRLLMKANGYLQSLEFDKALQISKKLLAHNPKNIQALELQSTVALETDDSETALECLNKAIDLQPGRNHRLYLSKAQIVSGKESLECYQAAISILLEEIRKSNESNPSDTTAMETDVASTNVNTSSSSGLDTSIPKSDVSLERELSSVYCSVAELFFTDLCDEPEAEDSCKRVFESALETDPSNPEAHITKARYLTIIGECSEAQAVLQASRALWAVEVQGDGTKSSDLSASLRLATAKLFIELEMHDDAQDILDSLLDESEQVVEVHYLLGWNCYLQGEEHHADALQHLKDAKKCESRFPCDDPQLVEHIVDLLSELGYDSDSGSDSDDDWTDAEDEDQIERDILKQAGDDDSDLES